MTQSVRTCHQCPLPYNRTVRRNGPGHIFRHLCETHYQEWVASRCRKTVVTYQGMARFASRCERAAKVGGYCTQHAKIKAKREGLTP